MWKCGNFMRKGKKESNFEEGKTMQYQRLEKVRKR